MAVNRMDHGYDRRRRPKRRRRRQFKLWCMLACLAVCAAAIGAFNRQHSVPRFNSPPGERISAIGAGGIDTAAEGVETGEDGEAEWSLILVNKWNPLPDQYDVDLVQLSNGEAVDERIYPALQRMFDAIRADGVYPVVASGYRTAEKQQSLMDEKVAACLSEGLSYDAAKAEAEAWVAIPGTSEHQLGIAVDINADGIRSAGHEVYSWLAENSCHYGFVYRYPPEKTELTGVSNEPWHYRYVGIKAAAEMAAQGLCLEEYLEPAK